MPRAVISARVSTEDQAASGLGVEAQIHACKAWADRAGFTTVGPFVDDGVSGAAGLDKRPGLLDAIAQLEPGDVLCVSKRDRLGRDPIVVALIEAAVSRKGCRVVSAAGEGTEGDDPTNILMRRLIDAFAEYERLIIKSRTRAALSAKRRRGERVGQVPFGFGLADDGKTLRPDPGEIAILRAVRRWRALGVTLRGIADRLNARGVAPKNGGDRWHHSAVQSLLRNTVETPHAPSDPEADPPRPGQPESSPA